MGRFGILGGAADKSMCNIRVLVGVSSLPASRSEQVPWHFFQELGSLAEHGVQICVASPVRPDYRVDGIEFRQVRPAGLRWQPLQAGKAMMLGLLQGQALRGTSGGRLSQRIRVWHWNQKLLEIAREWRPDVIHSHWAFPAGSGGMFAARRLGIPLVMTLRGIEHMVNAESGYGDCLHPFFESTLRQALRSAAKITICCSDSAKRLAELGVDDVHKIEMVLHAVGEDRFRGSDLQAQRLKSELGLTGRSVIACVAGMDHHGKGHMTLLDAFARVHARHPETLLLLVGDGLLRPRFEDRARQLGVGDHVRVVGRVHPLEVQHYMRMATLTVLPTLTEVFGNVVFESLYVGTPVIASAVGAPGDLLPSGPFGITFEAGNVNALETAIHQVLADLPVAREMARRGGELVRSQMSLERRASEFVRIYEQLTGRAAENRGEQEGRSHAGLRKSGAQL